MLHYYFRLATRNLLKNKLFSAIKIAGLAAGLAALLLVGLYLQHELQYDAFHTKADRIALVTMTYRFGEESASTGVTGNKVAPAFRRDFPEVESAVRMIKNNYAVKYKDVLYEEENVYFADSTLFGIFTIPLQQGDPASALNRPNTVVVTPAIAQKYFGSENPVGKLLRFNDAQDYEVTGVYAALPDNSQFKPDFIASFVSTGAAKPENETWFNANYATYLLLRENARLDQLQAKIPGYLKVQAADVFAQGVSLDYRLEPLRDVHLRSAVAGIFEPNGDIRYVYILSAVALLILLIGVTTFVNLSTAAGAERAREVGIQKAVGAHRSMLFRQHLGEAMAVTTVALLLGYGLSLLALPFFNELFDRSFTRFSLLQPTTLVAAVGLGLFISLLAGAYPAFVLSGFHPVAVLKGQLKFNSTGDWLRKSLIVLQFAISIFLIICTLALRGQLNYIQAKKIGFDKEFVLTLPSDRRIVEHIGVIKSEFLLNNQVKSVCLAYEAPTHIRGGYNIAASPTDQTGKPVTALPTDNDFVPTMGIEMAAGLNLSPADVEGAARYRSGQDTVTPLSILINESQAKAFGWSAEAAVNRIVQFNGFPALIKGVVRDFHFASFHEAIGSLVIFPDTWGNTVLVKLEGRQIPETLRFLEQKWHTLAPHRPFRYKFLDEVFDKMYAAEIRTARLVSTFSSIAILLACMGLFGLASYSIAQRTREIGIRKVLGAGTLALTRLLTRDFMKLVLVGMVLAIPTAYFLMEKWLSDFVYRIQLQWWMFALAGLAALAVAFLTLSTQTLRAALANPVKSLRSE